MTDPDFIASRHNQSGWNHIKPVVCPRYRFAVCTLKLDLFRTHTHTHTHTQQQQQKR